MKWLAGWNDWLERLSLSLATMAITPAATGAAHTRARLNRGGEEARTLKNHNYGRKFSSQNSQYLHIQSAKANQARKGRQYLKRLCPKSLWIKQAISGLSSGGQLRDIKGLKSDGNSAFIVEALTIKTPYMLWILHEIPLHHSVTDGNRKNVHQCNLFLALSLPYVTSSLPNQTQYILNFTSIDMLDW